jgi:hypothetical protein
MSVYVKPRNGKFHNNKNVINKNRFIYIYIYMWGFIQKFPDWPPGARTANGTALCH